MTEFNRDEYTATDSFLVCKKDIEYFYFIDANTRIGPFKTEAEADEDASETYSYFMEGG